MEEDINEQENNENGDKPYDLTGIRSITGDNNGFLEQLISVFISSISADLQSLNEKAKLGDWKQVSTIAHKIKSPLSQFGIDAGGVIGNLENQDGFNADELHLFTERLNALLNDVIYHLKQEFPGND
ncbi:MAG TPA: Hpt domain-containing protein [Mucilaginibacter sp.]|jgi:HPt (histidine-containing phosphotransfer) domain-containing protein|nr:Hpt domain-containing protein [Mucilaginibacter sp.]